MQLSAKVIYLNDTATAWPKAPGVADAIRLAIESFPTGRDRTTHTTQDALSEVRADLARLLDVSDTNRVVLTSGASHSLNIAILGLGLQEGDLVVTSVMEHNSVLRPLQHLQKRIGIKVTHLGIDEQGKLDRHSFDKLLKSRPKLVVLNHVSNVTGRINDVYEFFSAAKEAGATTLLDASQSMGHIPVHPVELCADIAAFTGHKGLRGPRGTGGLYVGPEIELEQVLVGGTGVRSESLLHPTEMPIRLEVGTPSTELFAGLIAALQWLKSEGLEFERKSIRLAEKLRIGLKNTPGVKLSDDFKADRVGIVAFTMKNWSSADAGYILSESYNIVCRTGLHCAPLIHQAIGDPAEGNIRFSISGFNTEEEIDTALAAIRELAA